MKPIHHLGLAVAALAACGEPTAPRPEPPLADARLGVASEAPPPALAARGAPPAAPASPVAPLEDATSRLLTALPSDGLTSRLDAALRELAATLLRKDVTGASRALRMARGTLAQMNAPAAAEQGRLPELAAVALSLDYAESLMHAADTPTRP